MKDYEVIIAGASFGGLAAAKALHGRRVLLIDRKPIGMGQTSACGTLYAAIEALNLLDCLRQVHNMIVLHTFHRELTYRLPYPFCTFEYSDFCKLLADRTGADFLHATVLALEGNTVTTSQGDYRAHCIIDASGWHASLSSEGSGVNQAHLGMSFGIETTIS